MSKTPDKKNVSVEIIHQSTVDRLSPVEKHFFEKFVAEGVFRVVPDGVTQ